MCDVFASINSFSWLSIQVASPTAMFKDLLDVEQLSPTLFVNVAHKENFRKTVFGGQVLAQSLMAAIKTVDDSRAPHSLHGYFLRAGDASTPIEYEVNILRDGGSVSSRSVIATQDGKVIFQLTCSFHALEAGYEHQEAMPLNFAKPEAMLDKFEEQTRISEYSEHEASPFKILPVAEDLFRSSEQHEPRSAYWVKTIAPLPDEDRFHLCALAFASDLGLLASALLPHPTNLFSGDVLAASIDHAMWFHDRHIRTDEWMLCSLDSPWAGNARGFARASIFTEKGRLLANTAQEGLIRPL